MKEIFQIIPAYFLLLGIAAFLFAVVMQPIFIWIICARMKATNATLRRMERLLERPNHQALPNPIQRVR